MSEQIKRRQLIVEGFQARFVIVQLSWAVVGLLVFGAVLMGPVVSNVMASRASTPPDVADQFFLFQLVMFAVFVAVTAFLALMFVRMSHRVAGVLHRLREGFRLVGAGRLDVVVTPRKADYLKTEAGEFNAMVGSLRGRISEARAAVADLDRALAATKSQGGQLTAADLDALQRHAARAVEALGRFSMA
jgi:methyl-accepting chemotaxis protein